MAPCAKEAEARLLGPNCHPTAALRDDPNAAVVEHERFDRPQRTPGDAWMPHGGTNGRKIREMELVPLAGSRPVGLRKEHQRLAVQSGKSHCGPQTSAATDIERDDLVLGDAVEMAIRPKAQTSRPAKFGQAAGREDAHKMSVRGVVFANGRRGIRRAERVLARYDNVAVGCDRQIKRAEFRVADQPDRPHALTGVKRNDSVVAQAFGVDPGGEKKSSVGTERKSAWKRHDRRWEERLAGGVK